MQIPTATTTASRNEPALRRRRQPQQPAFLLSAATSQTGPNRLGRLHTSSVVLPAVSARSPPPLGASTDSFGILAAGTAAPLCSLGSASCSAAIRSACALAAAQIAGARSGPIPSISSSASVSGAGDVLSRLKALLIQELCRDISVRLPDPRDSIQRFKDLDMFQLYF